MKLRYKIIIGFSGAQSITNRFGAGTGPIWMQGVNCNGNEKHLKDCPFNGWGSSNCAHTADVGIICAVPPGN